MSVEKKREEVLERLYDELLEQDKVTKPVILIDAKGGQRAEIPAVQLVVALENARSNDEDIALKGDVLAFDNANKVEDRDAERKRELMRLAATAGVTLVTNIVWGIIFVHELRATREFEVDGTETSAAGRWLKTSFPKVKMF